MPIYCVDASVKAWGERFGDERGYNHFVYGDVLFPMINTEDPPKSLDDFQREDPETYQYWLLNFNALNEATAKGSLTGKDAPLVDELADMAGSINISDAQVAYFKEVLDTNPDVRWTFCFMHTPPYFALLSEKKDSGNFAKIEALLWDRPYPVFSAHTRLQL